MHLTNLHPEEGLQCSVCHKMKTTKMEAALHFNECHAEINEEKHFLCSLCLTPFKAIEGLKTHIRIYHFQHQPLQCPYCEMKFDIKPNLSSHLKSSHPSLWSGGEKKYLCEKCDSRFYTSALLYAHRQIKHPSGYHACSKCGKEFPNSHGLKSHIKNVHEDVGCFVCDICGKVFTKKSVIKNHEKIHSIPDIPGAFPCKITGCNKVFGKKLSRDKHSRNPYAHGKERPKIYKCKFCSKQFSEKPAVVFHEKSIHLNVKDFKCDKCDFASASKDKLKVHITSIHDGVMYSCDYVGCTKSYNLKGNLDAHRFRVHKIARPKKAQILSNN